MLYKGVFNLANEGSAIPKDVQPLRVTDFGAKGDGSTDDYAAIQATIDTLKASETHFSAVYFPPGEYVVSQTVSMPHWIMYFGEGSSSYRTLGSALKAQAGSGIPAVAAHTTWLEKDSVAYTEQSVIGLGFDANHTATHALVVMGSFLHVERVTAEDATSHGLVYAGGGINGGDLGTVDNHGSKFIWCQCNNNGGDNFHSGPKQMDFTVDRMSTGPGENGMWIEQGTGVLVDGVHPSKQRKAGLVIEGVWQTRVTNSYFDTVGMNAQTGDNVYGLKMGPGHGPCIVSGNVVNEKPGGPSTGNIVGYQIDGNSNTLNLIFTDNTFQREPGSTSVALQHSNLAPVSVVANSIQLTARSQGSPITK